MAIKSPKSPRNSPWTRLSQSNFDISEYIRARPFVQFALFMVFVVYRPEGHVGPLWMAATELPHDFVVERRLYALEAWVTFGFLSVYLAITSLRPAAAPGPDA